MEQAKSLKDFLRRGLRNNAEVPADHPSLTRCRYFRATENGLKPFTSITNTGALGSTSFSWPWPQYFRGRENSYLLTATALYSLDASFVATQIIPIDLEDETATITNTQPWQYVDFGDTEMFLGSSTVLFKTLHENDSRWRAVNLPIIAAGCTYKDGQAILAGFSTSNVWPSLYTSIFSQYNPADLPDAVLTFLTRTAPFAHTNWVWWSSIGGGDLLMLLNPRMLYKVDPLEVVDVGDELVSNGTFTPDLTGWANAAGGSWTAAAGGASMAADTGDLTQTLVVTAGKFYRIRATISLADATSRLFFRLGSYSRTPTYTVADNGSIEAVIPASGTLLAIHGFGVGGATVAVDNISVVEVAAHEMDYRVNQLSIIRNSGMQLPDANNDWNAGDGTSSWIYIRRGEILANHRFYHADRGHGFWDERDWQFAFTVPADPDSHGVVHGLNNPVGIYMAGKYNAISMDHDSLYNATVVISGRTTGSVTLVIGLGSTTSGRKTVSEVLASNGTHLIRGMQSDVDAIFLGQNINIVPTVDFDGKIALVSLREEVTDLNDDGAMESIANHTVLTQLSTQMNVLPEAGKRYGVQWDQLTDTPSDIIKAGSPSYIWDQAEVFYSSLCPGPNNWWNCIQNIALDTDSTAWFFTSRRNILFNSTFESDAATVGWTLGAGWAWNTTTKLITKTAGAATDAYQDSADMWAVPVHARAYDVVVRLAGANTAVGTLKVRFGSADGVANTETLTMPDASDNTFHVFTIIADNAIPDWQRLYLVASSDFNASVEFVTVMDRTLSTDPWAGTFEVYGPAANHLQQTEDQMSTFPLADGESYEVTFTIFAVGVGQTVRPVLGGTAGTFRSAAGTFTETIVCGNTTNRLSFEVGLTNGRLRIGDISMVPQFTQGVRPVLATQAADPFGVSGYISNSDNKLWETFTRTIEVPAAPANLNLSFETEFACLPTRISRVTVTPLDSDVDTNVLPPKPLLFDYLDRNEAGFAPVPYQGTVYGVKQLGEHVIVYGDKFVCGLATFQSPIPLKAPFRLPGYPDNLGIASKGAFGGTLFEHVFVDQRGELWRMTAGSAQPERMRFSEFIAPLLGTTITVAYDPVENGFYIGNATASYFLREGKLSESPWTVTSLAAVGGLAVGVRSVLSVSQPSDVITNVLRSPTGGPSELSRVVVVGRYTGGVTDPPWTIYVDARMREQDAMLRFGPYTCDGRGVAIPKVYGIEHQVVVQAVDSRLVHLDDIIVFYSDERKPRLGRWTAG